MPKTGISNVDCFKILEFNNSLDEVYDKSGLTFEDVTNRYNQIKQDFEKKYHSNEISAKTIGEFNNRKEQIDYQKKWIEYAYYQIRNNKSVISLRNAIAMISKLTNKTELNYPFEVEVGVSGRIVDLHVYELDKEITKRLPCYTEEAKKRPIPIIKKVAKVDEDIAKFDGKMAQYNKLAKYKIQIPSSKDEREEVFYVYAGNVNDDLLQVDMELQKVFLQATEKEYLERDRTDIPYIGNFAAKEVGKYYIRKDRLQEKASQKAEEILEKRKTEKREERLGGRKR